MFCWSVYLCSVVENYILLELRSEHTLYILVGHFKLLRTALVKPNEELTSEHSNFACIDIPPGRRPPQPACRGPAAPLKVTTGKQDNLFTPFCPKLHARPVGHVGCVFRKLNVNGNP